MKRISTLLMAMLCYAVVFGQSPEGMSYQSVLRDASGKLIVSTTVGMRISILQGSITGSAIYVETQAPSTNVNGLLSLVVGSGTAVSGTFSGIDWAAGPYFIKTETDPTGGTAYSISGTSQLLSVPYALHAKMADSISGGITENDPVYTSSIASGITSGDTSNWNNKPDDITETDPVFGASVSGGITASDTSYWNNKPDGFTEIDPVFGASVAQSITVTDTAFWNDHTIDTRVDSSGIADMGYIAGIQVISRTGTTVTLSGGGGTYTDSVNQYSAGTNINISGNVISSIPTFYLGQDTMGGIVFYLYLDSVGNQHGMIVSLTDSSGSWQTSPLETLTGATSTWDGKSNTAKMTNSAAKAFVTNLGSGWYLPANDELSLLWQNRYHVNKALKELNLTEIGRIDYWSSTELHQYAAYSLNCTAGTIIDSWAKYQQISIRGVRSF